MPHDPRLTRLDATRLRVKNPHGVDAVLFANEQEAPFAFKGIGPVVETLTAAGIARAVAEVRPLLTVKG